MNNLPALNSLVDDINGNTAFLSRLFSRKSGFIVLIVLSSAIALKLVL